MAAGCGPVCARIMLIVFNVIFWLSGAGLLACGIWLMVDKDIVNRIAVLSALDDSGALLQYASYVLIGVGGFVLIVGFFGCCGAIKENKCMLGTYIFLLVIVMAAEVAAGVCGILFKDQILDGAESKFRDTLKEKFDPAGTSDSVMAFTDGLNFLQYEAKCCGWTGAADFKNVSKSVPVSCCVLKDAATSKDVKDLVEADAVDYAKCQDGTDIAFVNEPCKTDLLDWINEHAIIIIGVGIGIACLELFGFIFAVCLCRNVD